MTTYELLLAILASLLILGAGAVGSEPDHREWGLQLRNPWPLLFCTIVVIGFWLWRLAS